MQRLTYKEAYDKIITAYFKDEIKPLDSQFCFCGTLCENSMDWSYGIPSDPAFRRYSKDEYKEMEWELLLELHHNDDHPKYEDDLFNGMCNALDKLKEIHRSRGENVDDAPEFTKRQLTIS